MKTLHLVRHAVAMERSDFKKRFGLPDRERPLTRQGIKKFEKTVKLLKKMKLKNCRLYFSPYLRTRQTAEIIYRELAIKIIPAPALAHGRNPAGWLKLIRASRQPNVLLVGHEPELSDFVKRVLGRTEAPFRKSELRSYAGVRT